MTSDRAAAFASALCAALLAACLFARAAWLDPAPRIAAIELAVSDVERATQFFTRTLDFERVGDEPGTLSLGRERLTLRQLPAGAAPIGTADANDADFQHVAIVVSDIDAAVARLAARRALHLRWDRRPCQTGTRTSRASARSTSATVDGFTRCELHPIPGVQGRAALARAWLMRTFLGIDHTAIIVRDIRAPPARFYRDVVKGLSVGGESFNAGAEQAALSGVPGARVRVTSLRGPTEPGVELLEYLSPRHAGRDVGERLDDPDSRTRGARCPLPIPKATRSRRVEPRPSLMPAGAIAALRAHWQRYLMEAAELGAFMAVTIWGTLLLEHPRSPAHRLIGSAFARRALVGAIIGATVGMASGAHQVGTARFGEDPTTSVLDLNCKAHELDNLYVVDGSFFLSISAVNPGLAIMANALRVGDHLLGRLS